MDKTKRIIFFDLDGTLLDIDERWYQLYIDLAKLYNFDPLNKKIYIQAKKNKVDETALIRRTNINPKKINSYINKRIASIELQRYLLFDKIKPEVIFMLKRLSIKYKLVLITKRNKPQNCLNELKKFKLIKYFSKILIAKQDEKYTIIMKNIDRNEFQNSIIIGDTEDHSELAKKLDIKSILVADGSRNKKILKNSKPDYVINTLEELSSLIAYD